MVCTAQPTAESSRVAYQPPCTVPIGFRCFVCGVPWKVARPFSASTRKKSSVSAIGGYGKRPSNSACMISRPLIECAASFGTTPARPPACATRARTACSSCSHCSATVCACMRAPGLDVDPMIMPGFAGRRWHGAASAGARSTGAVESSVHEEPDMKAIAYQRSLPIDDPQSLIDLTLPDPVAQGHDLLVEVHAVSVNPVATKVRKS